MLNYVRNKQLKYAIESGRKELQETKQHVDVLEQNVDELSTEVVVQQKISERIKNSLEATKSLLDTTITEVCFFKYESATHRTL
jgi:cell division protein FtsB